MHRAMMEANLSTEVAMIVLDVVVLYTISFKVLNICYFFLLCPPTPSTYCLLVLFFKPGTENVSHLLVNC